jgi:hypothetical protein
MLWFQTNLTKDIILARVHAIIPTYLEYHLVQSLALSEPTLMCKLEGEVGRRQSPAEPAVVVAVGDAVPADAVDVNGSWGPWGEERHGGMQSDQDAAR